MNARSAIFVAVVLAMSCLLPSLITLPADAQTQTYPCETVIEFGTGMSTNGFKLRPGTVSSPFVGLGAAFPSGGDTFVLNDPLAAWIANDASPDSQWIGPSSSTSDDSPGVYVYYLPVIAPCAGARLTGRYAATDNGAVRLNGAPAVFPTPVNGATTWTTFSFNNLLPGLNRLEFLVTNNVGGRPDATGLRAELTLTATCCSCIELDCPDDLYLTTCSNGAPATFSITGTNRCFTNLVINCSLAAAANVPVASGSVFAVGTNTVICTASDTAGHRTNCSFRVVVTRDTRAPELRCPQDIVYPCSGAGTNVSYAVTVTDNAEPAPVVNCVPPSGSVFPAGTNLVVCQARDVCGNTSRCSFKVILAPGAFTKTLQAGVSDNFDLNNFEAPDAGPCLGGSGYWTALPFDTYYPGRHFSHCFQGLPNDLSAARLILRLKPRLAASQDDVLRIGLQNCGGAGVWAFARPVATLPGAGGTWVTNAPTTFVLDLAALPGVGSILPQLNATHRLEFAVGTETLVDFARLEVTYCGPQSTLSGVPYSLSNVETIHGSDGVLWRRVNSNGLPPTIQFDVGQSDGVRFDFGDAVHRICDPIVDHLGQTITWRAGDLNAATVRFELPGTNFYRTMVTLDQPTNHLGNAVEVWHDAQLVSRYYFPGSDPTGVTVPEGACIESMGFTKSYFFVNFTGLQEIDLKAPEVPATHNGPVHVSGQVGPVVMGTSVRLYFRKFQRFATQSVVYQIGGHLQVGQIEVLQGDVWIKGFGQQQLTVSDAILSKAVGVLPDNPYGVCSMAYGPWTLGLNGVDDFCSWDGSNGCTDGHMDVDLVTFPEGINFGGLRLTPTSLPSGSCDIESTVTASVGNNIIVFPVADNPQILSGAKSLHATSWPESISGNAGPGTLTAHFSSVTTVIVGGQSYSVTKVIFNAEVEVLFQFYQVCLKTTLLPQMSFKSFQSAGLTTSPDCLTLTCLTNVMVQATNDAGAIVRFSPEVATRCGSNGVVTCEPPSGAFFPPGLTVVQCSATDSQGSQEDCRFLVTVQAPLRLRATAVRPDVIELRWSGDSILEFKESLVSTAPWREVSGRTEIDGVERVWRTGPSGSQGFFRLRQP